MRTIDDMRQRVAQLIQKEIDKTEREIADFDAKIKDNEYCYGGGGWCTQFTKAKERREKYLEELNTFFKSSSGAMVFADEIHIYSYSCPSCMIKVMLSAGFGEKVDCPVCNRPIYKANDGEVMKVVRGSRQALLHGHYIELTSDGRIKD
jgi:hypothetical protein